MKRFLFVLSLFALIIFSTDSFATDCETVTVVPQTPVVPLDYTDDGNGYGYISQDGTRTYNEDTYGLTDNNTWATAFDDGVVYGRASCQPSMTTDNQGFLYLISNIESVLNGDMSFEDFKSGLSAIVGAAKADYVETLFGQYMAGTMTYDEAVMYIWALLGDNSDANYSTTDSGSVCYCQINGYQPNGQSKQSVSAPWVFFPDYHIANDCANNCAHYCASNMQDNTRLHGVAFGAFGASITSNGQCNTSSARSPLRISQSTNNVSATSVASGAYAKGAYNANVANINNAIEYVEDSSVATINSAKVSANNMNLSVNGFTPSGTVNVNSNSATINGSFNVPTTVAMFDTWGADTTTNGTLGGIQPANITNGSVSGIDATFTGSASGNLSGTGSFSNASVHVDDWQPVNPQ